jgi:hypothetical protein
MTRQELGYLAIRLHCLKEFVEHYSKHGLTLNQKGDQWNPNTISATGLWRISNGIYRNFINEFPHIKFRRSVIEKSHFSTIVSELFKDNKLIIVNPIGEIPLEYCIPTLKAFYLWDEVKTLGYSGSIKDVNFSLLNKYSELEMRKNIPYGKYLAPLISNIHLPHQLSFFSSSEQAYSDFINDFLKTEDRLIYVLKVLKLRGRHNFLFNDIKGYGKMGIKNTIDKTCIVFSFKDNKTLNFFLTGIKNGDDEYTLDSKLIEIVFNLDSKTITDTINFIDRLDNIFSK